MQNIDLKKQYSPYTEAQITAIRKYWDLYKSSVGLEGYTYLRFKAENPSMSEPEILKLVNLHFEDLEGEKAAWEALRSEIGK